MNRSSSVPSSGPPLTYQTLIHRHPTRLYSHLSIQISAFERLIAYLALRGAARSPADRVDDDEAARACQVCFQGCSCTDVSAKLLASGTSN